MSVAANLEAGPSLPPKAHLPNHITAERSSWLSPQQTHQQSATPRQHHQQGMHHSHSISSYESQTATPSPPTMTAGVIQAPAVAPLQSSSMPNLTTPPSSTSKPLSHKLWGALKAKPTLSRTWEKKSFMEEQRTAPLPRPGDRGNGLEAGMMEGSQGVENMSVSVPPIGPTSLYASPAAIAQFRALPPHSAPPTPTHATSVPVE